MWYMVPATMVAKSLLLLVVVSNPPKKLRTVNDDDDVSDEVGCRLCVANAPAAPSQNQQHLAS